MSAFDLDQIQPLPNCIVTVLFDRHQATFSYTCSHRSRGWQVLTNGNIVPPPVSRVVQFRLKSWPPAEAGPLGYRASFVGFQIVPAGKDLPSKSIHWPKLPRGVESVISKYPSPDPDQNDATVPVLTLDLGVKRWTYRLAVAGADGEPTWDDPKIHDDGSDW